MTTYTVYFAGDLFDHKHLAGNELLAGAVDHRSAGRYACVLPQDLEQASERMVDIRNQDLMQVMACDLGLFNFDGTDLDSGTVVEFMMAKMLDIPSVLLRSDFRASGDQEREGDPWNLMCSFYPRSQTVQFNAMAWYQEARRDGGPGGDTGHGGTEESGPGDGAQAAGWSDRLYNRMADAVIETLDAVRAEPSAFGGDEARISAVYAWAAQFPGSGFDTLCGPGFVEKTIEEKRRKGLL
ncbi:MAG: nucleoside 2-deoxyribosyltransferase [Gemmatimonadetes bacterium]|nr:nucleoside 2-deoxyribosyltransferase [Gemmatimonadota bacterium]MYD26515.1 nucleoside 2-deoxyribosyltransferase [Gemmatimonadota bacterium]